MSEIGATFVWFRVSPTCIYVSIAIVIVGKVELNEAELFARV